MPLNSSTDTGDQPPSVRIADRQIWAIAGPAIIANSSAPLVGLVDAWVIGHMPAASHLAAIGTGATLFGFIFWMFGFLRMGTTGVIAQAHGARDKRAISRQLARSLVLALFLGGLMLLLQTPIFLGALAALAPPDTVLAPLGSYYDIRILAAPATFTIYVLNGYLIGIARAKAALFLQLVLNVTNGLLNLYFVLGLDMGVAGIALGTLIAEILTVLVGLALVHHFHGLGSIVAAARIKSIWAYEKIQKLLSVNMWLFLRTLVLMTTLGLITRLAAGIGETALAASHIINVFMMLISLGLDGFAFAAEALTGAAWGKKDRARFRFWSARTSLWAGVASGVYALFFFLAMEDLVAALTTIEAVRSETSGLSLLIAFMPVVAVASYQLDGIFIGATSARYMFLTMTASFLVFVSAVVVLLPLYGLVGIWGSFMLFLATRGITLGAFYPRLERILSTGESTN